MKAKTILKKLQEILNEFRTRKIFLTQSDRAEILATIRALESELF